MTEHASAPSTGRAEPTGTPGAASLDATRVALALADAAAAMRNRSATRAELQDARETWGWLAHVPQAEDQRLVTAIAHGISLPTIARATGLGEADIRLRWARALAAIVAGLEHPGRRP